MLDCMDYITETSNDEKLPFLELIEAVSRSHRDSLSNDARYLNTNDLYNFTVSSQLDLCISSASHENTTTYCMTMDADDHLNMTDCDLNLLVDPRNGRPLHDDEEEDEDAKELIVDVKKEAIDNDYDDLASDAYRHDRSNESSDEPMSDFADVEFNFHPTFSSEEITDTSTQFHTLPVKVEIPTDVTSTETLHVIQPDDPCVNNNNNNHSNINQNNINTNDNNNSNNNINNSNNNNANNISNPNNRVLLIQIASPISNILKLNSGEVVQQKTCQIKPVIPQAQPTLQQTEKYDKPPFSYSCLIAMALRNSENGFLPVSEIYSYIIDKFPYFKTAPDGWKNSIRHNLSLNKCFQKLETPSLNGTTRKACLWGLNEAKVSRLNEEISKWIKKGNDANGKRYCTSPELTARQFLSKPVIVNEDAQHGNIMMGDLWTTNGCTTNNHTTTVDPTEFKLYKLVKVSKNNSPVADLNLNEADPIFTNINNQTLSWEGLLETSDLRSFTSPPLAANQRVMFGSNDSPISLTTVRASA